MTLIGPGTWEAARGAADAALTAAELVLAGEPAAYAACRPPGHHAARGCFGGSCYLNNAAIAAARLRDAARGPVAVIDLDAHHGNGTQQIFYEDAGVLIGSVHVDPGAGWFPHFLGFAAETGGGAGAGANRNLCLAPGLRRRAVARRRSPSSRRGRATAAPGRWWWRSASTPPRAIPRARSRSAPTAFARRGAGSAELGLPTVIVQEGGYDLDAIGELVAAVLSGLEEGLGV